jgi:hypothetical protein
MTTKPFSEKLQNIILMLSQETNYGTMWARLKHLGHEYVAMGASCAVFKIDGYCVKLSSSDDLRRIPEIHAHFREKYFPQVFWTHPVGKAVVSEWVEHTTDVYDHYEDYRKAFDNVVEEAQALGVGIADLNTKNLVKDSDGKWRIVDYGCAIWCLPEKNEKNR